MKVFRISLVICLLLIILVLSCKKEDEELKSIYQPVISEIIPPEGPINTDVVIVGRRFSVNADDNVVRCGTTSLSVTKATADTLWVKIPKGTKTSTITVRVRDITDADVAESPTEFKVLEPFISGYEPEKGIPGDTVKIIGKYFNPQAPDFSFTLNEKSFGQILEKTDSTALVIVAAKLKSGQVTLKSFDQKVKGPVFVLVPNILLLNPITAPEGSTLTIKGTNLSPTPKILFGQVSGAVISSSDSIVKVSVPTVLGSGETEKDVIVTVEVEENRSLGKSLKVLPSTAPVIYNLDPNVESVGALVTIEGKNFGNVAGEVTVEFTKKNGSKAPATINEVTDGQIKVTVPVGAISGNVFVTVEGQTAIGGPFVFPITYTNIKPVAIWEGSTITIVGSNFPDKVDGVTVGFQMNENNGGGIFQSKALSVNGALDQLMVKVPKGVKNNNPISITYSEMVFSNDEVILQIIRPTVESVTPNVAPIGGFVTISGYGFSNNPADNLVYFPGQNETLKQASVVSSNFSSLLVEVPAGTTEGVIQVKVLEGPMISGPQFKLGDPPPVIFLGSASKNAEGGVYRLTLNAISGSQVEKILDEQEIIDIDIDRSNSKIYAMSSTKIWSATAQTTGPLSWTEIYASTEAVTALKGIAIGGDYIYLTSRQNVIGGDNANGSIFRLLNDGTGSPELLYTKDNGFTLGSSDNLLQAKIEVAGNDELVWSTKATDGSVFSVGKPFNMTRGAIDGSSYNVIYEDTELLTAAGFSSAILNISGQDQLVSDIEIDTNNDIFYCHGIPVPGGSNTPIYQKIFKGNLNGDQPVKLSHGNIKDIDKVFGIALWGDYLYGTLWGGFVYPYYTDDFIFRMRKDGTEFQKVYTVPYNNPADNKGDGIYSSIIIY